MTGFSLFAQSPTAVATAWRDIIPLIVGGKVKPIVERVYPLGQASEALHHLMNDRPFGKVVLERISKHQEKRRGGALTDAGLSDPNGRFFRLSPSPEDFKSPFYGGFFRHSLIS